MRARSIIPYIPYVLFRVNVANQLYHPKDHMKTKQQLKMCKESITHIELNTHHSKLKINFLLLSRTFLPVGIAYKITNNHGFS